MGVVFVTIEGLIMSKLILIITLCASTLVFAQSQVAKVKTIRGKATAVVDGKERVLVVEEWLPSGAIVKTEEKSFVRLSFTDNSQMNVGPGSEMKIERFGGGDAGVIDLVKGKIRSEVSKDYLQQKDKDKSKLFIKTPNAVMGIRGTDFLISTNGVNSSAVLFRGEVVFNKLDGAAGRGLSTNALEAVVDRGVRVFPGEFSVVERGRPNPTVPSLLNVQQIEKLESNKDFNQASGDGATAAKSVVPRGLSGAAVANESSVLGKELEQSGVAGNVDATKVVDADSAKGFVKDTEVKPTNGSILHVDTGVVIAPPKDAVFDPNSGTYIPPTTAGVVTADGGFAPPPGMDITPSGEVLVKVDNQVVKLENVSPVTGSGATFGDVAKIADATPVSGTAPASVGTTTTTTTTSSTTTTEKTQVLADAGATLVTATTTTTTTTTAPTLTTTSTTFKEAPTLCATCGGAIPGTATTFKTSTPVTVKPTVGDP